MPSYVHAGLNLRTRKTLAEKLPMSRWSGTQQCPIDSYKPLFVQLNLVNNTDNEQQRSNMLRRSESILDAHRLRTRGGQRLEFRQDTTGFPTVEPGQASQ